MRLIVPPFPAVSRPSKTTQYLGPVALTHSSHVVRARSRVGRGRRGPSRGAGPRGERPRPLAVVHEAIPRPAAAALLTSRVAHHDGAGPSPCSPARPMSSPPRSTFISSPGCSTCPPAWCGRWSVPTRRGCSARRGRRAARFPLEVYVAVPEGTSLPAGVHWYDPREHALVLVGPPPHGRSPAVVVTGVPWRTGWRYRERGFRHVYWDAGTMLAQLLAVADSAGARPRLHTRFPDAAVAMLVGADGVHELPVAVVCPRREVSRGLPRPGRRRRARSMPSRWSSHS